MSSHRVDWQHKVAELLSLGQNQMTDCQTGFRLQQALSS